MAYEGTIRQLKYEIDNYNSQIKIKREQLKSLPASMKSVREFYKEDIERLKNRIAYSRKELARFREAEKRAKADEAAYRKWQREQNKASAKKKSSSSKKSSSGGLLGKLFGF